MKTTVLGVQFDTHTKEEAKKTALSYLKQDRARTIYTPNPEIVMAARKDAAFMNVLNRGDLVVPDGIGVVYAAKLNKTKIKERVAGYDLVQEIFSCIKGKDYSVYFLGSAPGVAELARDAMLEKHQGLKIAGVHHGYFKENEDRIIIDEINALKPEILLVGLGFPRQEKWIDKYKDEMPCKILMGVGGSFDGMCGKVKRAPAVYRRLGLEWLYRLIKQPSRIKRQILLPIFVLTVVKAKITGK